MSLPSPQPLLPDNDAVARYVRFQRLDARGFVEFGFAVGSPELMTDLILPLAAYREFCRTNQVCFLTREQEQAQDLERCKWRYGAVGVKE